jgi:Ankyrin repeats (3 copies)
MSNHDLIRAVQENNVPRVEAVLRDQRVDQLIHGNLALLMAAHRGHTAIVKLLLRDPRFDPSVSDNQAVRWAAYHGNSAIVELLLRDRRVDPSAGNNDAAASAFTTGHTAVLERLLCDARTRFTFAVATRQFPLRAMQHYAPKIAAVLSRLGLTAAAASSVLKQSLRLTGLKKKDIEALVVV